LAMLYLQQEKLSDAEPLLKDALSMRKRLFKADHPDVALTQVTQQSTILAIFSTSFRRKY
jgi:hypothetical protein